jgi:SHS2 domain-containing protein
MPKFRFLPNIVTADLAFEAFGKDYDELFVNAGLALESAMIELNSLEPVRRQNIKIESDSVENLLLLFLEELVFLKDAKRLLFNKLDCKVTRTGRGVWKLENRSLGEIIDSGKHKLGVDVKAVTKHLFKLEKLPRKPFRTQVVLDV